MSHNYPYRRTLPDTDLRPDPGPYGSSDRHRASSDHDFYRSPQESFSSSHPSSSSSSSRGAQWSQDGALGILNSCGLEPSDLAMLAELPEDVLTVESLPQVLKQIKGKRGTVKPFPPNAPSPPPSCSSSSSSSYPPSSSRRSSVNPAAGDWDQPRSQPLQYPLDHIKPSPLLPDLDRWGNPRSCSSDPPPSLSSSSYVVDFHHRSGPSEYGKTGIEAGPVSSRDYNHRSGASDLGKTGMDLVPMSSRDYNYRPGASDFGVTGIGSGPVSLQDYNYRSGPFHYDKTNIDSVPVSSQDYNYASGLSDYGKKGRDAGPGSSEERPLFRSAGRDKKACPSLSSLPGPADYKSAPPPTRGGHRESETSSTWSSSSWPTGPMPSKKEAKDFHGTCPSTFPYSCSLCDITVMSEKVWIKHINGPHHADGQLSLLQQFPDWDCRMETVERAETQASKVVCVKFPAQSVDEAHLRRMTQPFGNIIKILMFPSLAFLELESVEEAQELVKFHEEYPPSVNGQRLDFSISTTFHFLQSSQVVSFCPAPADEDGRSGLISIVKCFGSPLYTLFLPSKAYVEMKNAADAQKLVDFYSSTPLIINNRATTVSFSGEYKSLMHVTSAMKFKGEPCSTKRTRSSSREKEDKTEKRRRRTSKDREEGDKSSRDKRTRSRSREKSTKDKRNRTRSRSRDKSKIKSSREGSSRSKSRSRDKSKRDKRTRSRSKDRTTRSTSRDKSKEKSSREGRSRSKSRSRDKSKRTRSRSREKSTKDRTTRSTSRDKSKEKSSTEKRAKSKSSSTPARQNRSKDKSAVSEKTGTTDSASRTDPDPAPLKKEIKKEAESCAENSDIEGMEVIGEDGRSLRDAAVKEKGRPTKRTDAPGEDKVKVKDGEAEDQENVSKKNKVEKKNPLKEKEGKSNRKGEKDKKEPDFPVDLCCVFS